MLMDGPELTLKQEVTSECIQTGQIVMTDTEEFKQTLKYMAETHY